jgi:hypothetical protein
VIILIFVSRSASSVLAHEADHCGAGIALFPAAANIFSSVVSTCLGCWGSCLRFWSLGRILSVAFSVASSLLVTPSPLSRVTCPRLHCHIPRSHHRPGRMLRYPGRTATFRRVWTRVGIPSLPISYSSRILQPCHLNLQLTSRHRSRHPHYQDTAGPILG